MSREVFEMMEQLNQDALETKLALQCAPLLVGVKIANLLIVDSTYVRSVFRIFEGTDITVTLLCRQENKVTFFLYRRNEVLTYLNSDGVREALRILGNDDRECAEYDEAALDEMLGSISKKYESYMQNKTEFPHELGLVLGYPPKDVVGFVKHQGKDYQYSGYWKVYDDLEEALLIFESYRKARERLIRCLTKGKQIYAGGNL